MHTAVTASSIRCLPLLLWKFSFHSHTHIVAIKLNSISYRRDRACPCLQTISNSIRPSAPSLRGCRFLEQKMTEGVFIIEIIFFTPSVSLRSTAPSSEGADLSLKFAVARKLNFTSHTVGRGLAPAEVICEYMTAYCCYQI